MLENNFKSQPVQNPFDEVSIYKTTTKQFKNIKNVWIFEGKIFFKKGQTKGYHTVNGINMSDLLNNMRREMAQLKVRG